MGELQFNHREALSRANGALSSLRKEGKLKPPLAQVARRAGIQRSTIYTDHPDWERFREVVKSGLPLKEVGEAGSELEEKAEWVLRTERLELRIVNVEQDVQDAKRVADTTFTRLLAELHKYVMLSKETPHQQKIRATLLKENAEIKQENERLKRENAELRLQTGMAPDVRALAKKEVVTIYHEAPDDCGDDLEDHVIDAANSLDDFFATPHVARIPAIVYILCGNFASGKSRWIKEHSPLMPGVNLYVDGTNHTTRMRKLLLRRIKKLSSDCTVACVRVMATLEECLKRNDNPSRARANKSLPAELIMQVASRFEEISIDEGFDQILLVGQD